jgi:hypothetical protein
VEPFENGSNDSNNVASRKHHRDSDRQLRQGHGPPAELEWAPLLAPIILLLAAGYIALGARMPSLPRRNLIDELILTRPPVPPSDATGCNGGGATEVNTSTDFNAGESLAPITVQPRTYRGLYRMAAIAGAIGPMLWVVDLPSMLLMMGARFPRWVFALLVIAGLRGFTSYR